MRIIFNIPKIQIAITLLLIFITAFLKNPSSSILIILFTTLFSTIVSDLIFIKIRRVDFLLPSAAIVSALIISLLTSPTLPFYVPMVIGVVAMFSKNFLRFSNRHILNPAAFGLLIGSLIFGNIISWWGVSFQQFSIFNFRFLITFLILLSPALVSIFRMKRYRIILSFLVAYYLSKSILNSSFLNLDSFFDPTVLFFSLVMLPEPMTTPNRPKQQIFFGISVAILSIILSLPIMNSADSLILSLVIGNLMFFRFR